MEEKESTSDYLRNRLQEEIHHTRLSITSCTISTIRWLQRYSHCYSIVCSFLCLPFWILILPIAFVFDIFICIIASIVFIIGFIINILFAPATLAYKFSSCLDAWNPANIYRYSLREALVWFQMAFIVFDLMWMGYCGSGQIEHGTPIVCGFCCCTGCHHACAEATHIQINDRLCTIL